MAVEADMEKRVEKRYDNWIEVPAELCATGASRPLKLRPGADDGRVRIDPTMLEAEVDLAQLRQGLDLIEQEHQR